MSEMVSCVGRISDVDHGEVVRAIVSRQTAELHKGQLNCLVMGEARSFGCDTLKLDHINIKMLSVQHIHHVNNRGEYADQQAEEEI